MTVKSDWASGQTVNASDMNSVGAQVNTNSTDIATLQAADTHTVAGSVNGTPTALTLWTGTQAQYDAIGSKSSTTVYVAT